MSGVLRDGNTVIDDIDSEASSTGTGFGAILGLQFTPSKTPNLSFAASLRTPANLSGNDETSDLSPASPDASCWAPPTDSTGCVVDRTSSSSGRRLASTSAARAGRRSTEALRPPWASVLSTATRALALADSLCARVYEHTGGR